MVQFGISTACFFGTEYVEDAIEKIGRQGCKTIEVFLNTFSEYEEEYIREIRGRIDAYGMKVCSVHPHGVQYEPQLFSPYSRSTRDAEAIYRRVLRAAQLLGASNYILHGGLFFKPALKNAVNFARIGPIVSHMADVAKEYGIRLAYENVHWCWFQRPDFATEIQKYVESDNLYFNFDIKQAAQSGFPPMSYLEPMGNRLVSIHVCDYIANPPYWNPCMPFRGQMDFAALRSYLQDTGFAGSMVMEVYSGNYRDEEELYATYRQMVDFFTAPADISQSSL